MRHGASLPGGSGNAPVSVMLTRRINGECAFYTPLALRSQLPKAFRGSYMIPLRQVFKTIADMHAQKSRPTDRTSPVGCRFASLDPPEIILIFDLDQRVSGVTVALLPRFASHSSARPIEPGKCGLGAEPGLL
jgi:hypothetical protein